MKNEVEFLSIKTAARYLGVSPLTLRNWEKKGKIKAFRTPGNHRRYKKCELNKIMNPNGAGERHEKDWQRYYYNLRRDRGLHRNNSNDRTSRQCFCRVKGMNYEKDISS